MEGTLLFSASHRQSDFRRFITSGTVMGCKTALTVSGRVEMVNGGYSNTEVVKGCKTCPAHRRQCSSRNTTTTMSHRAK